MIDGFLLQFTEPPITTPDGYEETSDPRCFVLRMPDCSHREMVIVKSKCCGKKTFIQCNATRKRVTREGCILCGAAP